MEGNNKAYPILLCAEHEVNMQPPVGSSIFDSFFHFQEFLISQETSEYLDMFWLTCYKIRLIEFSNFVVFLR